MRSISLISMFFPSVEILEVNTNSRDLPFKDLKDLPDVFTDYLKLLEPLPNKPRAVMPTPERNSLPPLPLEDILPPQPAPFTIPSSLT